MVRLFLLCFVFWATPALALTPAEADARVAKLSAELASPFCPGKTLTNCTSYQAYELRGELKALVLKGLSDAEVEAVVTARYGQVTTPPQPWYVFFLPFLPLVIGLVVVGLALARWRRPTRPSQDAATELTAEEQARLTRLRAQQDP